MELSIEGDPLKKTKLQLQLQKLQLQNETSKLYGERLNAWDDPPWWLK
jgi:hypothetical protein